MMNTRIKNLVDNILDYRGELMFSYKPLTSSWTIESIDTLSSRLTESLDSIRNVALGLSNLASDVSGQLVSINGYDYGVETEVDTDEPYIKEQYAPYKVGDSIGQIIILPYPKIQFNETFGELSKTERGEGGHGSTGDRNQPKVSDVVVPKNNDEIIIK